MDLMEWENDGSVRVNFHPGQILAWDSIKRFVCVFSGTQGGKTEMGPPWLLREIQLRGPGDYMIVTPTFPLLELKALPAFKHLFRNQAEAFRGRVWDFVFGIKGEMQNHTRFISE